MDAVTLGLDVATRVVVDVEAVEVELADEAAGLVELGLEPLEG